jgi:hypothetical protein
MALPRHDSSVLGSNSNDYAAGILHLGSDTRPEVPFGVFKHGPQKFCDSDRVAVLLPDFELPKFEMHR